MIKNIAPFTREHYDLLLPLKKRWEIYKQSKTITQLVNINEQNNMNKVAMEALGKTFSFNCGECLVEALNILMNMFDEFEKDNL